MLKILILETKALIVERFRKNLELTRVPDLELEVTNSLCDFHTNIQTHKFDLLFFDLRANDAEPEEIVSTILTLPPSLMKRCIVHTAESVLALNMRGLSKMLKVHKVASPILLTQILQDSIDR